MDTANTVVHIISVVLPSLITAAGAIAAALINRKPREGADDQTEETTGNDS